MTVDVVANDTDVEGNLDPASVASASGPANGTVTNNGDGTFTYTPDTDFYGTDSFTYQVCDTGGACDTATVTIEVTPVNDPPVPSFTYSCSGLSCDFDGSGSFDPDGTIATYSWDFADQSSGSGETTGRTYAAAGTYEVVLTVTDNDGATGEARQAITLSAPLEVHVGDLEGVGSPASKGRWNATVTITVHENGHGPVASATVSGTWSDGAAGMAGCTTGDEGRCDVTMENMKKNVSSVTFTVDDVSHETHTYDPSQNHDPDGDSDGVAIVVGAP